MIRAAEKARLDAIQVDVFSDEAYYWSDSRHNESPTLVPAANQ